MLRRAINPTGVARVRQMCRALPHVLKQIFGAPDYATYLAHCRQAGHPPLTEKRFVEEFFAAKGKRIRCC